MESQMTTEPNPLRELIGLVDDDDLEVVRERAAAFRTDVTERFPIRERTGERE